MSYRGGVLEGYSAAARRAVVLATAEARQLDHPRVGTEHLLLGLLANDDAIAAGALRAAGATLVTTRHKVVEAAGAPAEAESLERDYTPRAQRALDRSLRFARQERAPVVGPQHLLLGVLDVEGLACQVLRGLGVDVVRLRDALVEQPVDHEPAAAQPIVPSATAPVSPRCPMCAAVLDDTLAVTAIEARTDDAATRTVAVVYCGSCGTTVGTLPPAG